MTLTSANHQDIRITNYDNDPLAARYNRIRQQTERLCEPLETEDYGIQSTAETSPPKWHLAHTAWFFETLLLKPYLPDYTEFHPLYSQLFNSYYDTIGNYHPRPERGLLSRPTVTEVYRYRQHVDDHMQALLSLHGYKQHNDIIRMTVLGLNHEQQHQELMLTDIKRNFSINPLRPAYREHPLKTITQESPLQWIHFKEGLTEIGHHAGGFAYDNEMPRHKVYLNAFRLASRPVTNAEFISFIEAGAYWNPELWLSDAWKTLNQKHWLAPLYWEQIDDEWWHMTLTGMQRIDNNAPVCHISFYEASAYARWAGKRLPTEAEWERAATDLSVVGNLAEFDQLQPVAANEDSGLRQMYGDVWEWTQSPYTPYPGYRQAQGAMGEYNGKFMSSQMVLRGGSCVTPADHIRASYRNFFFPQERWQFSGLRLAEDT